jgi:hypothetical protein
MALFGLGGYLALAGQRSHLYRRHNRNTLLLIDEIRNLPAVMDKQRWTVFDIRRPIAPLPADVLLAWAKVEVLVGLVFLAGGMLLPVFKFCDPKGPPEEFDLGAFGGGLFLFVVGGCLALHGHRRRLVHWNDHNTNELIAELRRLHATGESHNERISR